MKIMEFVYSMDTHTIEQVFDQSSCHRAFAEDALNVQKMNVMEYQKE